jgi:hypothetical protein
VTSQISSDQLVELREELSRLQPRSSSREFVSWRERTYACLVRALGAENLITLRFHALQFTTRIGTEMSPAYINHFERTREQALGLLDAAISETDSSFPGEIVKSGNGIDSGLWRFVEADVAEEQWGSAVSRACLYLEDNLRKWAARPLEEIGVPLMNSVLGKSGTFPLGATDAETEGWLLFAMGIMKALRNAAGHRISERPDHEQYATGVIGACSLLITQLKYEHGTEFTGGQ